MVVGVISCSLLKGACLIWIVFTMKYLLYMSPTNMLYCWDFGFFDNWAPAYICICKLDVNNYRNVYCRWWNLQVWVSFLPRIGKHEVLSSRNIYMWCITGLHFYTALRNQWCNLFLDLLIIMKDKFFCHQLSSLPEFLLSWTWHFEKIRFEYHCAK